MHVRAVCCCVNLHIYCFAAFGSESIRAAGWPLSRPMLSPKKCAGEQHGRGSLAPQWHGHITSMCFHCACCISRAVHRHAGEQHGGGREAHRRHGRQRHPRSRFPHDHGQGVLWCAAQALPLMHIRHGLNLFCVLCFTHAVLTVRDLRRAVQMRGSDYHVQRFNVLEPPSLVTDCSCGQGSNY